MMRRAVSVGRIVPFNTRPIAYIQKRTFMGPDILVPVGVTATVVSAWLASRYKISRPNQYLVRTGLGIDRMLITKKGMQWPFQTAQFINMTPTTHEFDLKAMSAEMLEFVLPMKFTIGPGDTPEMLERYATYLLDTIEDSEDEEKELKITSMRDRIKREVDSIIKSIIEGETRILVPKLPIQMIFADREAFKQSVVNSMLPELAQFGLKIYNGNLRELRDVNESGYFENLRQKALAEAKRKARVDIQNADVDARIKIAESEAQAVATENSNKEKIANSIAQLEKTRAEAKRVTEIAQVEAEAAARSREAELQQEVEQRKAIQEVEALRATEFARVRVQAEKDAKEAEGKAAAIRTMAEAQLYKSQQEAEGIRQVLAAQAEGAGDLVHAFSNDPNALAQYLMIRDGMFPELARANAEAVRGMNPKINVWNQNGSGKSEDPIGNVLQNIPLTLKAVKEQTGVSFADWLVNVDGDAVRPGNGDAVRPGNGDAVRPGNGNSMIKL